MTSKYQNEWTVCCTEGVSAIAFDAITGLIADAHEGGVVRVRDGATGMLKHSYGGHAATVYALAFSPDSQRPLLASASCDGTVQIWDAHSGERFLSYQGHSEAGVYALAWSPDGKWLLSGGGDRTVQIWDSVTGKVQAQYQHSDWVWDVAWSPDGMRIASASNEVLLHWWQEGILVGQGQLPLTKHGIVNAVAFHPGRSAVLAVAGSIQLLEVWEVGRLGSQILFSLPKPETLRSIYQLSWAPDADGFEQLLVREGVDDDARLRLLKKASLTYHSSTLELETGIAAACWIDACNVAIGTVDGQVLVRNIALRVSL